MFENSGCRSYCLVWAPPGMDEIMDGKEEWGNLTWKDFIEGYVTSFLFFNTLESFSCQQTTALNKSPSLSNLGNVTDEYS